MKRVPAPRFKIEVRAAGGEPAPQIGERTVTRVVERRGADLLPQAGQFHVGQPFDGLKEIIDARLGEEIEAEIGPLLVGLEERARLLILPVFALEKIADDKRVALISEPALDGEIAGGVPLFGEEEPP